MSRPPHPNRVAILADLGNLNLSVVEIAERHSAARRTVYNVAEEYGINMWMRTRLREAPIYEADLEDMIAALQLTLRDHRNRTETERIEFLRQF